MNGMNRIRRMGIALQAAVCLLLGACTEREALSPEGIIRLGAGTNDYSGMTTRASVNDLKGLSAVGDCVGIYGVVTGRTDAAGALLTDEWRATPLMDNVRTTGIDAATGVLSWDGTYAYPLEADKSVKFCVYHPYAASDAGSGNYVEAAPGASPVLHFKLTGAEDVMWVQPVTGSRQQAPGALVFDHKLTQLRFRLVDEEGNYAGTRVTGMTFNGVNTVSTLGIETGELGEWSVPSDAVAFPLKTPVEVTGTSAKPQVLEGEVMLQPGQPVFRMTVTTDNKGVFRQVEIRPTGGETAFAAGRSYLVTLTFRERTAVALSAVVTPWVMAGYGEGTVE